MQVRVRARLIRVAVTAWLRDTFTSRVRGICRGIYRVIRSVPSQWPSRDSGFMLRNRVRKRVRAREMHLEGLLDRANLVQRSMRLHTQPKIEEKKHSEL